MHKKYKTFTYLIWVGSCVSYSYNILNLERKKSQVLHFKIPNFCVWTCYSYSAIEYLGLGWDNFDFLYHDAVQLNHKNNWVVGGLGHTVHQACVAGDFRPLHQGLGRVTPLGGSISAQINRHNHSLYNMPLNKSAEPYFQQQKINFLTFWGWLETTLGS